MRNEKCGVVVVAMSPRLAYWDVGVRDHGWVQQVFQALFGLCQLAVLFFSLSNADQISFTETEERQEKIEEFFIRLKNHTPYIYQVYDCSH